MLSVCTGLPDQGKSTILYDLAARISREGRRVLIATAEDHLAAVVAPRLKAAGANMDNVHIVTEPMALPEDLDRLARTTEKFEAALVTVDPLVAFMAGRVDTDRDHSVRVVLAPLAAMAERLRVAIVTVVHSNKNAGADPLLRVGGSIGFVGAARVVLIAARHPEDESRRVLAVLKNNLAVHAPALEFRLDSVTLEQDGEQIETSRVAWLDELPDLNPAALLSIHDPDERTAIEEAKEWLIGEGVDVQARRARELERDAEQSLDISKRTLRRARERLGIPVWKGGFRRGWMWGPRPPEEGDTSEGDSPPRSPLSPSLRPGETGPPGAEGDSPERAEGDSSQRPASSCPECGAASADPGYVGHANGCPRYAGTGA
jgi:hypothetical protein